VHRLGRDHGGGRERRAVHAGAVRHRRALTLITGRSVRFSGTRQVVIGLAAAGLTFGIGRLIGSGIG
jgi:hypothetical protein